MSLIGGCFSKNKKIDKIFFEQKVNDFSIIPSDNSCSYKTIIFENQFGYISAKFKTDAPRQIRYTNNENFSILTLGFHKTSSANFTDKDLYKNQQLPSSEDPGKQIENSEGEFVSLLMDHNKGDIHIINDRFSSRPFFILHSIDGFVFSSNITFLHHFSNQKKVPDPLGWLQIFNFGHTLDTRTNCRDIYRLRPATHIVISKEGLKEKQYWNLKHSPNNDLDSKIHAENTFKAMQESASIRSRLMDKGFLSLSGGLDSRLVASAKPKEANYYTFTFVDSLESVNTLEVQTASEVSKLLGREHHIRHIPPAELSKLADILSMLTGGLVPLHHPTKSFQSIKEMKQCSGFKMGGGPGDSLAGAFPSSSVYNLADNLTNEMVHRFIVNRRRFSNKILSNIFRKDILSEYFPQLDKSMEKCFERLSGPTAAHKITAWAMVFRQPAFTFNSPIHNHPDVTEASPHLGYKYADLMLQLPASWILRKNFYKFMIYHCIPELRNVVYANTGEKLPGVFYSYQVTFRKKVTGTIEKYIPYAFINSMHKIRKKKKLKPAFEYNLLRNDSELIKNLKEILHSVSDLSELLNIKKCEYFINNFQEGKLHSNSPADEAELLGSLATLCYWYKILNH